MMKTSTPRPRRRPLHTLVSIACAAAFLFATLKVSTAQSPEAAPPSEDTPTVHVEKLDPDADTSAFSGPQYKVHEAQKRSNEKDLPLPAERDSAFAKAGLAKDLKDWDGLDKDVLYARARNLDLKALQARYPKLDAQSLKRLQEHAGAKAKNR